MKKLIVIFTLLSLLVLCSCNPSPSTECTDGVTTRTVTHDRAGRIVQEITYNVNSGLTVITTYTYVEDNGFVLVNNVTTIIIDAEGNRIE